MSKKEKGITLIALVITIIVLLILAGVAISMLSGENGILTRASEAKTQTENKSEEEQVKLAATEAMMSSTDYTVKKDKLKEVLKEKFGTEGTDYEIIDIVDGWEIEVIKTKNHYSVFKDGSASYLEWYYEEDPDNSNRRTIITNGEIKLKVGDYIDYNSADTTESIEKTTYTSPTGTTTAGADAKTEETPIQGSGYSEEQTFDGKAYEGKWKVLGVDEKTGEILIVSADTVQTTDNEDYWLEGFTGYQYGEAELNNICKTFGYGTGASGARSINVADVNKLTGYNPNNIGVYDVARTGTGTKYGAEEMSEYGNKVTYKWTDTQNKVLSIGMNGKKLDDEDNDYITYGFNWFDGSKWRNSMQNTSIPATITTITSTYYDYKSTDIENGITTESQEYKTVFCNNSEEEVGYWLGTQMVITEQVSIYCFGMSYRGSVCGDLLYLSDGSTLPSCSRAVRPVVSLKTDIELTGSSEVGWTIQK